jgi:glycerol uptake facilitator-like aquaporin
MMELPISKRVLAEAIGTAFLLAAVVGSGIMAERLAAGNVALALLANAVATGAALYALITAFGPWSGAHFNPAVSLVQAACGEMRWRDSLLYVLAQVVGAVVGVWIAHLMFALPIFEWSVHVRTGIGQWAGEFVATFGLLFIIESGRRKSPAALPATVATYITAAYWFTSSTSFANPAVTIARSLTDTFAGIGPNDVVGFVLAQVVGAAAAVLVTRWLFAGGKNPNEISSAKSYQSTPPQAQPRTG